MDKNTLSIFGWIIVASIVLSILIIGLTPYGETVQKSTKKAIDSFEVRAEIKDENHQIKIENEIYGNIQLSKKEAKAGEKINYKVDAYSGYAFKEIKIEYIQEKKNEDGDVVAELVYATKNDGESFFIMPDSNVTVSVAYDYID